MRAELVFPPLVGTAQPYSSLPALAGFVRRGGRHEIIQCDANLEFVLRLLSPPEVRIAAERVAERFDAMHTRGASRRDSDEYRQILRTSLKAPIVHGLIGKAVEDLRQPDTYRELGRLQQARRVVRDAFEIHSASCYPVSLGLSYLSDEVGNAGDLDRRARDVCTNPFRTYFADSLLPAIQRDAVGALGISITYPSQILPAVTLALLARERLPGIPVVFGGQIASRWSALSNVNDVFRWCDYLVCFEGETALEELLSALDSRDDLGRVPNLVYLAGDHVVRNAVRIEEVGALPTPDYQGLPLDQYLAPEPVFLLNTSRGCYWSACEFCSVSPSMRGQYRRRAIDAVRADIAMLRAKHGARCFMLGDDCVRPDTLEALAGALRDESPPLSWECQARFEPALTSVLLRELERAGCRNLAFGLESYSPRVLSAMRKGVRHTDIARILDDCRDAGIAFNLQLFFGFPGETEEDARTTMAFLLDQMHGAATFSAGTFELQRGSGIARRPAAFGVHLHSADSLSTRLPYTPHPAHAVAMKQLVERELAMRMRFPEVPLSIDAHTLLFLHHGGVPALASQYYRTFVPEDTAAAPRASLSPDVVLRRKTNQSIVVLPAAVDETMAGKQPADERIDDHILMYDYDVDRAVELSPFALCILQHVDGCQSIEDVSRRCSGEAIRDAVVEVHCVLQELLARHFLQQ